VWEAQGTDGAQARAWALHYATRWVLAAYPKASKPGRGAERLPRESAARWLAAMALMSGVALRLIARRERLRRHPEAEAAPSGWSPLALEGWRHKSGRPRRTGREVALAIGRWGGHRNRTREGWPGWHTRWHGMHTLPVLVEGVLIAHRLKSFG
jgi:hypothetical protein